jgi:hypothetical protein
MDCLWKYSGTLWRHPDVAHPQGLGREPDRNWAPSMSNTVGAPANGAKCQMPSHSLAVRALVTRGTKNHRTHQASWVFARYNRARYGRGDDSTISHRQPAVANRAWPAVPPLPRLGDRATPNHQEKATCPLPAPTTPGSNHGAAHDRRRTQQPVCA